MMETREIKGEIEGFSRDPRKLNDLNGCRGIKIEGEWHNRIDLMDKLENLDQEIPKGTLVRFTEAKNKKGYWDIKGDIEKISKQQNNEPELQTAQERTTPDRNKDIILQVCAKIAAEIVVLEQKKTEGIIDLDSINNRFMQETQNIYK